MEPGLAWLLNCDASFIQAGQDASDESLETSELMKVEKDGWKSKKMG